MGAMLATFCMLDVRSLQLYHASTTLTPPVPSIPIDELPVVPASTELLLFGYGQPRTGNSAFVEYYERIIKSDWLGDAIVAVPNVAHHRIVFRHDIVPTLPPKELGYHHPYSGHYWIANGGRNGDGDVYACPAAQETANSARVCQYNGFRTQGHRSYFWNFDEIRAACGRLDAQIFHRQHDNDGVFFRDFGHE
jgi:hypothetical protein